LAQDLKISVITTKRAYFELEQQKLVITRPGKGSFIADYDVKEMASLNLLEIERQIRGVVTDAKRTGVLRENLEDIFYKTLEEEY
jgi:GntR family transcriptional regulator